MMKHFICAVAIAALFSPVVAGANGNERQVDQEPLDDQGLLGVSIVPVTEADHAAAQRWTGIEFTPVDRPDEEALVIRATHPEVEGRRVFLGLAPLGTYEASAVLLRERGLGNAPQRERRVALSEDIGRVSILPSELTDLGELAFSRGDAGLFSVVTLLPMGPSPWVLRQLQDHIAYQGYALVGIRGWDEVPDREHRRQVEQLRAVAPVSAAPLSTAEGRELIPTSLGAVAVRSADGETLTPSAVAYGPFNFLKRTQGGYVILGDASGLLMTHEQGLNEWISIDLPVDFPYFSIVDAALGEETLRIAIETRPVRPSPIRYRSRGGVHVYHRELVVVEVPWPHLDEAERLMTVNLDEVDRKRPAVLTADAVFAWSAQSEIRRIPLDSNLPETRYKQVSGLHRQGGSVFLRKRSRSGSEGWFLIPADLPTTLHPLEAVFPEQPPALLPDGRLLIHGRMIDERGLHPAAYYVSDDRGVSWQTWGALPDGCHQVHSLYVAGKALYQLCSNQRLHRSPVNEADWSMVAFPAQPSIAPEIAF